MNSTIIIVTFWLNGNVGVTTQSFKEPCPSQSSMNLAAQEIKDVTKAIAGIVISCSPATGKMHSYTIPGGRPA